MRIYIREGKINLKLSLPTNSLLRLAVWKVSKGMDAQQKKTTKAAMKKAVQIIKEYKKENGAFTLVEIEEKGKESVKIII